MAASTLEPRTILPPEHFEAMNGLSRFLDQVSEPTALLGPDGQVVPLPIEAYRVLVDVVAAMREGRAITLVPTEQRLTTQQAADFLGISRPTLVKLLEKRELPYDRTTGGRHRRVRLQDLLEYRRRSRVERRAILDDLTRDAVATGLYDADAESYSEALKAARRKAAQ